MKHRKLVYKRGYVKEAVIQSELYMVCRVAGMACDLQYSIPSKRQQRDMPDLVVIEGYEIIAIVEVKDYSSFTQLGTWSSEQITRYKKHNVPVFILYSVYDIPYLIKELIEVRKKFLESIDPTIMECSKGDRQSEKNWDNKIAAAFDYFDEVFPDYKFTSSRSLESLADGVKVLGLEDVLELMDDYVEDNVENFFLVFDELVAYRKSGPSRFLNTRKYTVHTVLGYQNRQDKISKKLS
jgi:CRISPR/Cas system CSM-associated protein Csm2 small subunit